MSELVGKTTEEEKVVDNDDEGGDDNANPEVFVSNLYYKPAHILSLQAEESTAVFAPVVHLVEVEVKTHEEEEDVVFKRLVHALLPLFQV
jgi:hypothetical protein